MNEGANENRERATERERDSAFMGESRWKDIERARACMCVCEKEGERQRDSKRVNMNLTV